MLLCQLSMELQDSWFGVLKRKLWFSRQEGVKLPTRLNNESVYQLQQSIENVRQGI